MTILAYILCAILTVISALHVFWAAGGSWPGHDRKSLALTVIGANGIEKMPPAWVTELVACCIMIAGICPLFWVGVFQFPLSDTLLWLAMVVLVLVFVGRGISGYLSFFRNSNSEQPFADLDQKYYSPLCLFIGLGFIILLFSGRNSI